MKIQTKLIIAFLAVGILPMWAALYLSSNINERLLNKEGLKLINSAVEVSKSREIQVASKTAIASKVLAEDSVICSNLYSWNLPVVAKQMQDVGAKLQTADMKVNDIEYLGYDQLKQYVKSSTELVTLTNPIWQGYTITTTKNGASGIMTSSISKIEYKGKILGAFKVGIWVKESMIDVVPELVPGVQASILPIDFKVHENDPESDRLKRVVFGQGIIFRSENLKVGTIPFLVHCYPLKDYKGQVLGAVFLGSPKNTVAQVWSQYKKQFYGLMFGVCFGLAIILGYIITHSISRPIRELVLGVEQIKQGNLDYRIKIHSRDEMKDLADSFNSMTEKLKEMREIESQLYRQEKMASLGKLSAGLAHEIRNPLGAIKSYAGILRDKFLKEGKEREIIQIIIDEVNRLNSFITDFLDFAKPKEPKTIPLNMHELLERSVHMAQTQYSNQNYQFVLPEQAPATLVSADPSQMQQVFLNLTLNACQSMPEGGTLKISYLETNPTHLGICFEDQGIGISEADQKRIFDPFFTTRDEGTGLGLSVVNQIVENHHGKIEIESKPGEGTRMIVYLPYSETGKTG